MSTTPFSAFLPQVLPFVSDCPQIVALDAIKHASIEFCEKTYYWQYDSLSMSSVADPSIYIVTLPPDTMLVDVFEVFFNGRPLVPKSADELANIYRFTDWRSESGEPVYFTFNMPGVLQVVPSSQSNTTSALSLRAVLAPTRTATSIDTLVYQHQLDVIAKGARARLHAMVGQPFYDNAASALERKEFLTGIGEAKIKANKGLSRASGRVGYNFFA